MSRILRPTSGILLRGLPRHLRTKLNSHIRDYTDTPKTPTTKNIVVRVQGTETEQRLRVRLARPSDVPRVLRFVREHTRVWPGPLAQPSSLVLGDYVARTLAQGHSMLAEQHPHAAHSELRGLALCAAVCPWDAGLLEKWARCVKCSRSRRLIHFTSYCLRAPKLHDKYRVNNILQVILIVPPDVPKSAEIANVLVKKAIKRGEEAGFPVVRFDATKDCVANSLEKLHLNKEWYLSYNIIPESVKELSQENKIDNRDEKCDGASGNFVAVYSKVFKK